MNVYLMGVMIMIGIEQANKTYKHGTHWWENPHVLYKVFQL